MRNIKSKQYFRQALKSIPGGVNSPVRAFSAVGGDPLFIKKGKGCRIYDADNNSYIDYVLSWGPLILGHARKEVVQAIIKAAKDGTSFGAPTKKETELAELIKQAFPGMDKVRLVSSGTEATMSAIRLARAVTGKDKIVKFEGCYHGHSDSLLVKAGSGAATFGVPTSLGVPRDFAKHTLVLPFNDIEAFQALVAKDHAQIAAVIVEPVCGNMGVVVPNPGYLKAMRKITQEYGILLIFDEVITGFRFCFGGAQKLFEIKADITCLGKIIGGGMPLGAYAASKKIMAQVSPLGKMYQAGTLSGNPVAVSAGLKTLQILQNLDYNKINDLCEELCLKLKSRIEKENKAIQVNGFKSMFTIFFTKAAVRNYQEAKAADTAKYAEFFKAMLGCGIYLAPAQFESNFISFAHGKKEIQYTVDAMVKFLRGSHV